MEDKFDRKRDAKENGLNAKDSVVINSNRKKETQPIKVSESNEHTHRSNEKKKQTIDSCTLNSSSDTFAWQGVKYKTTAFQTYNSQLKRNVTKAQVPQYNKNVQVCDTDTITR